MKQPRSGLKYVPASELGGSKTSFKDVTVEDPGGEKLGKLEGFIMDVDEAIPYYTVVDAGRWFRSKHVLIPVGHVVLDSESKTLLADVPKARITRFPGFDLALFSKLTSADLDRMADEIGRECCPDVVIEPAEQISRVEVWAHYRTPAWWDHSFRANRQGAGSEPTHARTKH